MTNEKVKAMGKRRKQQQLEVARADLAAKEPTLLAALKKAEADLKALRKALDIANERKREIYSAIETTRRREAVARGLTTDSGLPSEHLQEALKVFAHASGFPDANLQALCADVITRELATVESIVVLETEYKRAVVTADNAYRAWNVATSPFGDVSRLSWELRTLRDTVEKLERYCDSAAARNGDRRMKRQKEQLAARVADQTKALRNLLSNFVFKAPAGGAA